MDVLMAIGATAVHSSQQATPFRSRHCESVLQLLRPVVRTSNTVQTAFSQLTPK
jgi:hypothetical protein